MDSSADAGVTYLGGAGWGVFAVEIHPSDGKMIGSFTVEHPRSPDAAIVPVPALASTLNLARLRGDLAREQERASPPSPTQAQQAIRERAECMGEPLDKVRTAAHTMPPAGPDGAELSNHEGS